MRRVIQQRCVSLTTVVALSLAIGLGMQHAAFAEGKSMWHPSSWFADSSTDENLSSDAQRRAEEARQEAEHAEELAKLARQKAEKARQEAEAIEQHSRGFTKPVVSQPDSASATPAVIPNTSGQETTPNFAEQAPVAAPPVSETKTTPTGAQKSWNLTRLWHRDNDSTEQATEAETRQTNEVRKAQRATREEQQAQQAVEEQRQAEAPAQTNEGSDSADKGGRKLLDLFHRSEDKAKADSTQEPKAAEDKREVTTTLDQSLQSKAALIETEKGNIAIELYPDEAPLTVANFIKLINSGFYNKFNMRFHRVIPGFVIQTGDPTGTGAGGSQERIPLEAKNKLSHNTKGVVAMARGADPDSASSQFYITLAPQTALDGKYAIFGRVISGMEVLDKIEKGDMLYGIRMVDAKSVVRDPKPEKKKLFSSMF